MRGSPALKESKLYQWGPVWECPLIDIKGFVPGDLRFHTTSGGWSVLVISVLWSLRVSVIVRAFSIASCCQSHSLFCVLVSQRESDMLSADTPCVQCTFWSSPYSLGWLYFILKHNMIMALYCAKVGFLVGLIMSAYMNILFRVVELEIDGLIILFLRFCWRHWSVVLIWFTRLISFKPITE